MSERYGGRVMSITLPETEGEVEAMAKERTLRARLLKGSEQRDRDNRHWETHQTIDALIDHVDSRDARVDKVLAGMQERLDALEVREAEARQEGLDAGA